MILPFFWFSRSRPAWARNRLPGSCICELQILRSRPAVLSVRMIVSMRETAQDMLALVLEYPSSRLAIGHEKGTPRAFLEAAQTMECQQAE